MDLDTIAREVKKLDPKAKRRFDKNVLRLFQQFRDGLFLRRPYRLVLDSNIIMRLESYRRGSTSEGLLSVFLFFDYFEKSIFDADIVVMPSVFYEFLHQRKIANIKEHWKQFLNIKTIIEKELGRPAFFDDIETFEKARYLFEVIKRDSEKIEAELRKYRKVNWRFDLIRPPGEFDGFSISNAEMVAVPPYFLARGLYEGLELEYFDEEIACRFLIEHMAKYISECEDNNQTIVNKFLPAEGFLLAKILRLSKKGIRGIADIDILSRCNVQVQSNLQAHGKYTPASVGLSIDKNLARALSLYSQPYIGLDIEFEEENMSENVVRAEAADNDLSRMTEGESRKIDVEIEQLEYLKEIYDKFQSPVI